MVSLYENKSQLCHWHWGRQWETSQSMDINFLSLHEGIPVFLFFLIWFLVYSIQIPDSVFLGAECYDPSGRDIGYGHLECHSRIAGYNYKWHGSYKYYCRVKCLPGYQSAISVLACSSQIQMVESRGSPVPERFEGYWNYDISLVNCTGKERSIETVI